MSTDTTTTTTAAATATSSDWTPDSWRARPIRQCPTYPGAEGEAGLRRATAELAQLPPLVHAREVERLKASLRDVARGEAFLLQGGDCAELFDYCRAGVIEAKVKLLLQMSLVLVWGADRRVVRIARMAGQYAKPRSSPTEEVALADGSAREVPSFRGDILNGFRLEDRELDPQRLVKAYHHSAATLNYVRAALAAGLADLHRPLDWSLGHVEDPALKAKYTEAVVFLRDMLRFMRTIGADRSSPKLDTVDLYTSHEGLLLEYEQSLTRLMENPAPPPPPPPPHSHTNDNGDASPNTSNGNGDSGSGSGDGKKRMQYYDTSAHFLWIGDRTRQLDGAHVEFFRGVANPIGVKIGPTTTPSDLLGLLRALNPGREPGKVTLITRYGAARVRELLPAHIRAVEGSEYAGGVVVWQCDPMHGNTRATAAAAGGVKTRRFGDILAELREALAAHAAHGTHLGGVHLELTGDAVTECTGGSGGPGADADLSTNYTSFCDPRLNEKQALELAFLVADHYRQQRGAGDGDLALQG